jgi:murein DD-endopeptidase MepM/ murein hydrolase activator NlpD
MVFDATTVKGELGARLGVSGAADARQPAAPQLIALAPALLDLPRASASARLLAPPLVSPLGIARAGARLIAPAARGKKSLAAALDVALRAPAALADVRPRVALARLPRAQQPLLPIPMVAIPFSDQIGTGAKRAVTITAAPGQVVAAPEAGVVVFAGAFRSYGKLLIIEHQREYHTLLWGFSELGVARGDRVRTGQIVGVMADDAEHSPELHVELRRHGRPVNPLPWLAASSNKVRG